MQRDAAAAQALFFLYLLQGQLQIARRCCGFWVMRPPVKRGDESGEMAINLKHDNSKPLW